MKKAILRLAAIGALLFMGSTPYKTLRFDIQDNGKPLELKYLYEGSTPLIRGQLYQGGSTWSPSTNDGWGAYMWYGTNYLDSTAIVKVQAAVTTNAYIDFQFSNNDTATNGTYLGGMTMTNASQTITWNHLTIQLQKDPGSQAGTLHWINLPTGTGHGQLAWYNTNTAVWTTLNIGSEGYKLTVESGLPAWVAGTSSTGIESAVAISSNSNAVQVVGTELRVTFDTNKYTRGAVDSFIAGLNTTQALHTVQIGGLNTTQATHSIQIAGLNTTQSTHTTQIAVMETGKTELVTFNAHANGTGTAVHGLGTISTRSSNDFSTASEFAGHTNATGSSVHGLGTVSTLSSNIFVYTYSADYTTAVARAAAAWGWGDHALVGYITNEAVFLASAAYGITSAQTNQWTLALGFTNEAHTAYGWGNHALAGYLTAASTNATKLYDSVGKLAVDGTTRYLRDGNGWTNLDWSSDVWIKSFATHKTIFNGSSETLSADDGSDSVLWGDRQLKRGGLVTDVTLDWFNALLTGAVWRTTGVASNGEELMSYQVTTQYIGGLAIVYTNTPAYTQAVAQAAAAWGWGDHATNGYGTGDVTTAMMQAYAQPSNVNLTGWSNISTNGGVDEANLDASVNASLDLADAAQPAGGNLTKLAATGTPVVAAIEFVGSAGTNAFMQHLYYGGTNYLATWMLGATDTNLYPVGE